MTDAGCQMAGGPLPAFHLDGLSKCWQSWDRSGQLSSVVEQLICNQQVVGSSPTAGSIPSPDCVDVVLAGSGLGCTWCWSSSGGAGLCYIASRREPPWGPSRRGQARPRVPAAGWRRLATIGRLWQYHETKSATIKRLAANAALPGIAGVPPQIQTLIEASRQHVASTANLTLVWLYWNVGRVITEDIQRNQERAEYGEQLLQNLGVVLKTKYGEGFSLRNLRDMRRFFECF